MENINRHPEKCPITGRPFFMDIENENGEIVPTYGGVFDSYTIPVQLEDGTWMCERYDHDEGGWVEGEEVDESMILSER